MRNSSILAYARGYGKATHLTRDHTTAKNEGLAASVAYRQEETGRVEKDIAADFDIPASNLQH